jgi:hypothetical protein
MTNTEKVYNFSVAFVNENVYFFGIVSHLPQYFLHNCRFPQKNKIMDSGNRMKYDF